MIKQVVNVFIDTGIFIHLFDVENHGNSLYQHSDVKKAYEDRNKSGQFYTTNYIIAETFNFLLTRLVKKSIYSLEEVDQFWDTYISTINTVHLYESYIYKAWELLHINNFKPFNYSFIDALSLSFIQSEDNFGKEYDILTTDINWRFFFWDKGFEIKILNIIEIKALEGKDFRKLSFPETTT